MGSRKGTFDSAILASMKAGVTYVVAAGNIKGDACQVLSRSESKYQGSPGGISGIITVGSVAVDSNEDEQVCHFKRIF